MTTTILPTRNEAYGFFGTMQLSGADPMQGWNAASAMIAAETDASAEAVRDFLDSRHGRHFADDVASELWEGETLNDAIDAAIARWMGWRIDRRTSRPAPFAFWIAPRESPARAAYSRSLMPCIAASKRATI